VPPRSIHVVSDRYRALPPEQDPFYVSPFRRLARVHALMAAGDAVMAVALADSLFLSISPDAARSRVLLFILVSFVPFAVLTPFIGPFIDRMRGGRRMVVRIAAIVRFVVALGMIGRVDDLVLFPLALVALVLQKTYAVSKSALVPTVVRSEEELVEANSKLGLISGIVGAIVVVPAAVVQRVVGSNATLLFDAAVFLAAFVAATRLPAEVVAARPARERERIELHATSIRLAAAAMVTLRASVGFVFFHLAFWLRGQSAGTFWFGLALALAALATMAGNLLAPGLRRRLRVEVLLVGALGFVVLAAVGSALGGGVLAGVLLAPAVNFAAAIGRLAFESIVQRDAPDANRGRAFAQFELRFQLAWVCAGTVPVVIGLPGRSGPVVVGLLTTVGLVWYVSGLRSGTPPAPLRRRVRGERARDRAHRPRPGSASNPDE
jgi:hypothetical protein